MRAAAVVLGFGLGVASGCPSSAFVCQTDSECGNGLCESNGYCSFEDESCDSGRRFEPNAGGGLGGTCVPVVDGTESTTTSDGDQTEDSGGSTGPADSTGMDESSGAASTPAITVDPSVRFQTVDGFGVQAWDSPFNGENGWNWELAAPRFAELDLHYAQMIGVFFPWEPGNDNDDPYQMNWMAFDPSGSIEDGSVPMAQWLVDQGYDLIVQKVVMPDWLHIGGEFPGEFDPELYPELAETIISHSLFLEDNGAPNRALHIYQINTDNPAFTSPSAAAEAGSRLASSIETFGVDRTLLTPAVPGADADAWLTPWFANDEVAAKTEAIMIRGIATSEPADFATVGAWSEQTGIPVWAWDNWYCGADEGCPAAPAEDSSTWASAWEQAQQNVRLLVHARAARIYHAAMVGSQSSIDPQTGEPYPTFWVLAHFANWIPPDGVVVETRTEVEGLLSVAVERPDGTIALVLLNTSPFEVQLDIDLPSGPAQLTEPSVQSIAGEYLTPLELDGSSVALPVDSLTSLTLAGS